MNLSIRRGKTADDPVHLLVVAGFIHEIVSQFKYWTFLVKFCRIVDVSRRIKLVADTFNDAEWLLSWRCPVHFTSQRSLQ
jgi:hypothetical protein